MFDNPPVQSYSYDAVCLSLSLLSAVCGGRAAGLTRDQAGLDQTGWFSVSRGPRTVTGQAGSSHTPVITSSGITLRLYNSKHQQSIIRQPSPSPVI